MLNMFCVSLIVLLDFLNAVGEMTIYKIQRMKHCLDYNEYMQQLGLPVATNPFANTLISPEKQNTRDSGSEYNGEDEPNSDGHPSDDNLESEKDDCLQELDTTISSLLADKVLLIP